MSEHAWNELESMWRDEGALERRSSRGLEKSVVVDASEQTPVPLDDEAIDVLVRRCHRRRVLFWLNVVLEFGVVVGWLAYSSVILVQGPAELSLAVGVIVLTLLGWGVSLWNRSGLWRSLLRTPLECARSEVRRARASKRAVLLGWVLLLAIDGLMCTWHLVFFGVDGLLGALPTVALVTSVYVVALVFLGRRASRSLVAGEALVRALSEGMEGRPEA